MISLKLAKEIISVARLINKNVEYKNVRLRYLGQKVVEISIFSNSLSLNLRSIIKDESVKEFPLTFISLEKIEQLKKQIRIDKNKDYVAFELASVS